MKIALAQLHYHLKNETYNFSLIQEKIKKSIAEKHEMIVFSSLYENNFYSYHQMQFVTSMDIIHQQVQALLPLSQKIGIVLPFLIKNNQRRRTIFYYLYQGNIEQQLFDYHYLYGEGFHYEFNHQNHAFGVYFFEDIITNNKANFLSQIHKNNLSPKDIVLLIGNANFGIQSFEKRYVLLQEFAKKHPSYVIFLNTCGEYNGDIMEGKTLVLNEQQKVTHLCRSFQPDFTLLDTQSTYTHITCSTTIKEDTDILHFLTSPHYISQVYEALKIGIQHYFYRSGFTKCVIGLSGGIDSAVVASIATDALGKKNVTALLLPSPFSTTHSVDDAVQLAQHLEINYHILPIQKMYHSALDILQPIFQNSPIDITEENIQSRTRGLLLMALANKQKSLLLNTSNKSELCAGYGTLYGDLCGAISVLGDIYKTQVYALAKYINNEEKIIIPENTIIKPPSAELRPNQKDTDSLPEYELLDKILYLYVDKKISQQTIILDYGFDKKSVEKIIDLFKKSRYKTSQTPDVLKVSL